MEESLKYNFEEQIHETLVAPLISGNAYYVDIKNFSLFHTSNFCNRYDETGLPIEIKNGHINDDNIMLRPYIVHFEFRYDYDFIKKLKGLFAEISGNRYCSTHAYSIKDLRLFDIPCATFGDFSLNYIHGEGWYQIQDFYLETFESIPLEYARIIAKKLQRMSSYLYFNFLDSSDKQMMQVYSDFQDYSLMFGDSQQTRIVSKILTNTKRPTFSAYQIDPFSSMAMLYRLRLFFLRRRTDQENFYFFIIFLSDEEAEKVANIRAWANVEY